MADRMAQAGALQQDAIATGEDYGDERVNREQTTGAGHVGIGSRIWYHNDRHDYIKLSWANRES
jgi:hypothetical protein